jgi:hypothetical protein
MPTIKIRDITEIYYKGLGTGQPVVFSHDWPLSADARRRCILSMLILCSTVLLLAAIANAQELPASTSNAAGLARGWWSPVGVESAQSPQLLISMAELTHFDASDSFRTSQAQPTTYRVTESIDNWIAGLHDCGLGPCARVANPSLLADRVSLPPASFLSLLQAKYTTGESSLEDSRFLTDVNGVFVYPLLQINYEGWRLPVTLYISSLRGSDAR